jgi:hypothetical protein
MRGGDWTPFRESPVSVLRLAAITMLFLTASHSAADAPDEGAILDVVDRFFLALHRGDAEAFEAVVQPHSRTVYAQPEGAAPPIVVREGAQTAARMRGGDWTPFRESYWAPTVLQRGRLASVWLPYVLVREDTGFSHCGIDQFSMTRTDAGWRIDFVAFTIEPTQDACEELGMPAHPALRRPRFDAPPAPATPDGSPPGAQSPR